MSDDTSGAKPPERIWINPEVAVIGGFADPAYREPADVEYVSLAHAEAMVREWRELAEAFAEQEIDYMTINELGDPELQSLIKRYRALAQRQTGGEGH